MTTPTSAPTPDPTAITQAALDAAVKAILTQADRLGLRWRTIPATVVNGADPNDVTVLIDGDAAPSRVQSIVGAVYAGARVMTMWVWPNSIYIIGFLNNAAVQVDASENTLLTNSSGTYVTLSPTCATTFIAPPSGKVNVHAAATIHGNAAATFGLVAPQIRETNASGTIVYPGSDNDAVQVTGTSDMSFGKETPIPGLTPYKLYYAELVVRSNGTGSYNKRKIIVKPVAN